MYAASELAKLGYEFRPGPSGKKSDWVLRQRGDDQKGFEFKDQGNYNEVANAVVSFVQQQLVSLCELLPFPLPPTAGEANSVIYATQNFQEHPGPLLLLVCGSAPGGAAGVWGRSLCINATLHEGAMFDYIFRAEALGWAVVVANPNINEIHGIPITGSESPHQHLATLWKSYMESAQASNVLVVAHSYGAPLIVHLLKVFASARARISALAFTDAWPPGGFLEEKIPEEKEAPTPAESALRKVLLDFAKKTPEAFAPAEPEVVSTLQQVNRLQNRVLLLQRELEIVRGPGRLGEPMVPEKLFQQLTTAHAKVATQLQVLKEQRKVRERSMGAEAGSGARSESASPVQSRHWDCLRYSKVLRKGPHMTKLMENRVRYLPLEIRGACVLVKMGGNRYRIDNSKLNDRYAGQKLIDGEHVQYGAGLSTTLVWEGLNSFSIDVGGERRRARLIDDSLVWNDGDVWTRDPRETRTVKPKEHWGDALEQLEAPFTATPLDVPEPSSRQDAWSVLRVEQDLSLYTIFDGHGPHGHDVANFAKNVLPRLLAADSRLWTFGSLKETFTEAFRWLHQLIDTSDAYDKLNARWSGCTGSAVLHAPNGRLYLAHVGDSSVVVGGLEGKEVTATQLTRDHKPELKDEMARIIASGGLIDFDGFSDYRIYNKEKKTDRRTSLFFSLARCSRLRPGSDGYGAGLNMTRSLGDLEAHRETGLIADPECREYQLGPNDQVLLLCSDGIWEFMRPQESPAPRSHATVRSCPFLFRAVDTGETDASTSCIDAGGRLKEGFPGRNGQKEGKNRNAGARAQEAVDLVLRYPQSQAFLAAEELVNEAKRRWIQQAEYIDDITVSDGPTISQSGRRLSEDHAISSRELRQFKFQPPEAEVSDTTLGQLQIQLQEGRTRLRWYMEKEKSPLAPTQEVDSSDSSLDDSSELVPVLNLAEEKATQELPLPALEELSGQVHVILDTLQKAWTVVAVCSDIFLCHDVVLKAGGSSVESRCVKLRCSVRQVFNLGLCPEHVWVGPDLDGSRIRILDWSHAEVGAASVDNSQVQAIGDMRRKGQLRGPETQLGAMPWAVCWDELQGRVPPLEQRQEPSRSSCLKPLAALRRGLLAQWPLVARRPAANEDLGSYQLGSQQAHQWLRRLLPRPIASTLLQRQEEKLFCEKLGGEVYTFAEEENLHLQLLRPPNSDSKPGCMVLLHGGSWISGSPSQFYEHAQAVAKDLGVAVATCQYRLISMLGWPPCGIPGCDLGSSLAAVAFVVAYAVHRRRGSRAGRRLPTSDGCIPS
eukprot:g6701.t1